MAAAEISLACCLRFAFRWGPPGITALSSRKAVDCVHAAWSAPVSLIPAFHHLQLSFCSLYDLSSRRTVPDGKPGLRCAQAGKLVQSFCRFWLIPNAPGKMVHWNPSEGV